MSQGGVSPRGEPFFFLYNNVIVATIVAIIFLGPHWLVSFLAVNLKPRIAGLVGAARTAEVHVGLR